MIDREVIRQRWEADGSKRDERGRRLFAASEVRAAGWGGLAAVSSITGLARSTIERGVIELIAATTAKTGLKVESILDTRVYAKGIKVANAEMKRLDIRGDAFHPEWNYSVIPRTPKS